MKIKQTETVRMKELKRNNIYPILQLIPTNKVLSLKQVDVTCITDTLLEFNNVER